MILLIGITLITKKIEIIPAIFNFSIGIIWGVALAFILPGIVHIWVILFGGKEKYFNTFKPIVYGMIIWVTYSFILFVLSIVFPIDQSILQGFENLQDSESLKQSFSKFFSDRNVIINILISLVGIIHVSIFSIKSVSKFQKISKLKAFWAIVLAAVVIIILIILLQLQQNVSQIPVT